MIRETRINVGAILNQNNVKLMETHNMKREMGNTRLQTCVNENVKTSVFIFTHEYFSIRDTKIYVFYVKRDVT